MNYIFLSLSMFVYKHGYSPLQKITSDVYKYYESGEIYIVCMTPLSIRYQ
jgi:hypothetical protein